MVGERIKAKRKELGWSLAKLSDESGLSRSFLCEIENDKRSIGADSLNRIGESLGLSLDYLMSRRVEDYPETPRKIPDSLAKFGRDANLRFNEVLCLAALQNVLKGHNKKHAADDFDWAKLYEAVKEFL